MRIKKCSFRYLGHDEDVFPKVYRGTVLTTETKPLMKATLLQFDGERMVPVDNMTEATVTDGKDGKIILSGVSALAEGEFGPHHSRVDIEITPHPNCKNCT